MSLVGNRMNSIVIVKDSIKTKSPMVGSVKKAQHMLKELDSRSKEEIIELARNMFNGVIRTNFTDGLFLRNVINIVIDWGENLDRESFANFEKVVRGYDVTNKLSDWQKMLFSKLRHEKEVQKIYIFSGGIVDNFWVIVDNPSTDVMLKFSNIYMKFLAENIHVVCDFMVFGQNEINDYNFPKETIVLDCGV